MTGDIVTPDFAVHPWHELASVEAGPESVVVAWGDGAELTCHPLWLYEMSRSIRNPIAGSSPGSTTPSRGIGSIDRDIS